MINVYIDSITGNTLSFANTFLKDSVDTELNIVRDLRNAKIEGNTIAIAGSTWGDGKISKRMKNWIVDNSEDLKDKDILIFGSGFSIFTHYARAVDSLDRICTESGARTYLKLKFEQAWDEDHFDEEKLKNIRAEIKRWERTYYE